MVCFKNQSKNYRVNPLQRYCIALNLASAKVSFCWCNDSAYLSDYFVMLLWACAWANTSSVRFPGGKGKNKQMEPGEVSRHVFRDRLKQFWAGLLPIASSRSDELYRDELISEAGLLFPASHRSISCHLLTLVPHFRTLIWRSLFSPICSFPGFGLPSGSTAGNVVIHRFLSCKLVE